MPTTFQGKIVGKDRKFGIVISRFNEFISSKLLEGTLDCLQRHEVADENIDIAWVPGSFEIPLTSASRGLGGRKIRWLLTSSQSVRPSSFRRFSILAASYLATLT